MQTALQQQSEGHRFSVPVPFHDMYNALELFMNIYSSHFFKKKRVRIKLEGNR